MSPYAPPSPLSVLQEEQVPPLPPNFAELVAAATAPPVWGSTLEGFPPAWPMATAVTHHCRHPPRPPPPPPLPTTAFAHLRRQAAALDALRPRLDACCRRQAPLPCARRAVSAGGGGGTDGGGQGVAHRAGGGSDPTVPQWKDVLDGFCTDEFGVKTRQYHCCRRQDAARRRCFIQAAEAGAAEAAAFVTSWDPAVEPPFPPGEPTATNMGNICGLRGLRPGPNSRSGPRVRMQQRLEHDYGRCCRNGNLTCAHDAVSAGGTQGGGGGGDRGWGGQRGTQAAREGSKAFGKGPKFPGRDPSFQEGT